MNGIGYFTYSLQLDYCCIPSIDPKFRLLFALLFSCFLLTVLPLNLSDIDMMIGGGLLSSLGSVLLPIFLCVLQVENREEDKRLPSSGRLVLGADLSLSLALQLEMPY